MLSVIRRALGRTQAKTAYDQIGGEVVLKRLSHRFYQLMDQEPEYAPLRALHPSSLAQSEQKLFEFLSGWLGGPPLFEQKYGHPMLRARHLPFRIDKQQRNLWLHCMKRAMELEVSHRPSRQAMLKALVSLADHMRNVEEGCPISG
ncbi:group II truncated hemoglobin [Ferrimonas marina]|uniref:Hemoglobin n=1 Tax=Ferrimonas marina TaxID=299255 RepID=A0A1M5ZHE4_9GAMM|nr:group II truncated hemoglobin [Ferrimonas marina]SHI23564.1 hemoglobin [Ferrimonas marina]